MIEQEKQLEAIFMAALQKESPEDRLAFAQQQCGTDRELLQQIRVLLNCHEKSLGPLDVPPSALALTTDTGVPVELERAQIGAYKLLQKIGEGGFGVVFMAEQTEPVQRRVALKIIKPGMDTREVVARFEAERQALAMMDHPNIARVFDGGETESGRPYFVMELVRGVTVTEYCDKEDLTPSERLNLFVEICHAVQHAHQKGIVHRDIKPSNILVTQQDGRPLAKVIDFGVAKALHHRLTDKTLFTNFFQIIGTPLYMSPEQANLNSMDIDTRTDIYSLGVLLYELLVGSTPFDRERLGKAAYDEMRRILQEEDPPPLSARLSTLGDSLSDICRHRKTEPKELARLVEGDLDCIAMKALDKDRARRYDSASGLAADVQRFLNNEPIVARPPSAAYRLRKLWQRNRLVCTSMLAITLAILLAATIATLQAVQLSRSLAAERELRDRLESREQQVSQLSDSLLDLTTTLANRLQRSSSLDKAAEVSEMNVRLHQAKWGTDDVRTLQAEHRLAKIKDGQGWIAATRQQGPEGMALAHINWYRLWNRMRATLGEDHEETKKVQSDMLWQASVFCWVYAREQTPSRVQVEAFQTVREVLSQYESNISDLSLAVAEYCKGDHTRAREYLARHFQRVDAGGFVLDALLQWELGNRQAALDSQVAAHVINAGWSTANERHMPALNEFWKKEAADIGLPAPWPPLDWPWEKYIESYCRLIERFPNVVGCYSLRGDAYGRLEQWEMAAEDFRKVTKMKPDSLGGWESWGAVCLEQGDLEGYRRACEEARVLALAGQQPDAGVRWRRLAMADHRSGSDFQDILDKADERVRVDGDSQSIFDKGVALYRCGKLEPVDSMLSGFNSPTAYAIRAMAAQRLGDSVTATELLRTAETKLEQFSLDGEYLDGGQLRSAVYCLYHATVREAESLIAARTEAD